MNAKLHIPLVCYCRILRCCRPGGSFPSGRTADDVGHGLVSPKDRTAVGSRAGSGWMLRSVLCVSLCVFAAILLLPVMALAVEMGNASGIVSEGYDSGAVGFVTQYQENYSVMSDVPNGMFTTSKVRVDCSRGRVSAVYRNGEPFEPEREDERYCFSQAGAYAIVISDVVNADLPSRVFAFRIVDQETADFSLYSLPECVQVGAVQRDGKSLAPDGVLSNNMLDLRTEGEYLITWQAGNSGSRQLSFHNYPKLPLFTLKEAEKDYSVKLNFGVGLDRIVVYKNGRKGQDGQPVYSAANGVWDEDKENWLLTSGADENKAGVTGSSFSLSQAGTYTVLAYGKSGEGKLQVVTVRKKRDVAGFFSIVLLIALGIAAWLFLRRAKKMELSVR